MQFGCESCKAQLQIADEKVRGKRLIVRCKRCGAKITISDPALGAARPRSSAPPASGAQRTGSLPPRPARPGEAASAGPRSGPSAAASDTDSTRAMDSDLLEQALQASKSDEPVPGQQKRSAFSPRAALSSEPIWFAMLHGKQAGPFTQTELKARTDEGAIGPRTYLWKDGMTAWQRAKDLPELQGLFPQLPEAASLPPKAPPPAAPLREFSQPAFAARPRPAEPSRPQPAEPEKPASTAAMRADKAAPAAEPAALPQSAPPAQPVSAALKSDPLPFGDLVHEGGGVERDLFTPEKQEVPKPAELANWAAGELELDRPPQRSPEAAPPRGTAVPRMFEGAAQDHGRGPFVLVALGVVALAAVLVWLFLSSNAGTPPPKGQGAAPPASAKPAAGTPPGKEKPSEAPKPAAPATGLTPDQVGRKIEENKGALQGCVDEALRRDPNLKVGKIHIATTIAPTGAVTQAKIDKAAVEQSPLGACLRRATRKIAFPAFGGPAFNVDIPIAVSGGD